MNYTAEQIENMWARDFFGLGTDHRFVLLLVAVGCLTGGIIFIAALIAGTVRKMRQARLDDDLKREMIERGMSAEEIAQVIEAESPPEDYLNRWITSRGKKSGG